MAIIGIDLGTTKSCVAVFQNGEPAVIASGEGARTTPSVVAFTPSGELLVGSAALDQAVSNPTNTVFSIKRLMGRKRTEVGEDESLVPYRITSGPGGDARVRVGEHDYSPVEISAMILEKVKFDAEAYLGEAVEAAFITVPAYFNDDQRQATKDAARVAGFEAATLINAPTAAALAYGLHLDADQTILVFDLGGGTLDVSVLEIGDGVFDVKSAAGDNQLGGDDFDRTIIDWLLAEFERKHGFDVRRDKVALQRVWQAAQKARIELSSVEETQINLPFITADSSGPNHLDVRLTRAKCNELAGALIERVVGPVRQAIDDAKDKGVKKIDHVVMVGGMSRMPAVHEKVGEITGRAPNHRVNADEGVAVGAAIRAGIRAGEVKDVLTLDITPLTLGIETKGGVMTKLIERNTTIPTRKFEVFSTAEDKQQSVEIHVLQGERDMAMYNKSLGKFQLTGIPPAPRGIPQIEVGFDIDADGIVKVSAKDRGTGKEQKVEIKGGSGLTDEEIDDLLAASAARAQALVLEGPAPVVPPEPAPVTRRPDPSAEGLRLIAEGQALEREKDSAGAEAAYVKAVQSGELRAAFYLGRLHERRDSFKEAVDAYRQALEAPDGRVVAWAAYELGRMMEGRRRFVTAAEYYNQASQLGDAELEVRASKRLNDLRLSGRIRKAD